MRRDMERQVYKASAKLVQHVLLLVVATVAQSAAERWQKRQRNAAKQARRNASKVR